MVPVTLGPYDLNLVSVGGAETCLHFPALKLCMDIGRCPPSVVKVPTVFFTHCHADHMAGVITHAASRSQKRGWPVPTYYLPEEKVSAFHGLMEAWDRLVDKLPCTVIGLSPGDVVPLRTDLEVRPFRAIHTTPSLGYALSTTKKRLRPEYTSQAPKDLIALKKAGVDVNEEVVDVHFAFCGDTNIDVLRDPLVRAAKTLVLEITFLDESVSPEQAYKGGHIHIEHVKANLDVLEGKQVLFTHPSQRYSNEDIVRLYEHHIPDLAERGARVLCLEPEWSKA
jgi:ribonuclease Z